MSFGKLLNKVTDASSKVPSSGMRTTSPVLALSLSRNTTVLLRDRKRARTHSRPQRPRSFWSAPGIETSGRLQHRKSAIHGLIVKHDKSDWLKNTERDLCACSEIGISQRSRFLAQTRRIAASGDENGQNWTMRPLPDYYYWSVIGLMHYNTPSLV